jgi:hypothetical protein
VNAAQRCVLLDECLPQDLRHDLAMFDVQTAKYAGLAGLQNGALLAAIDGRFDVLVTVDGNLPFQQNLTSHAFGVVVLGVNSNRLPELRKSLHKLEQAIASVAAGQVPLLT